MLSARITVLVLLPWFLMGFYTADRRVLVEGECAGPAGSYSCKVGGQSKTWTVEEIVKGAGRKSCIYRDPSDNSEAVFKRLDGNLFLSQTNYPDGKKSIEYNFLESDDRGAWHLYMQDPNKAKEFIEQLTRNMANDADRIKAIIAKEGDISIVPDKNAGTDKLSGPAELIFLMLSSHTKSVLTKVGTCQQNR